MKPLIIICPLLVGFTYDFLFCFWNKVSDIFFIIPDGYCYANIISEVQTGAWRSQWIQHTLLWSEYCNQPPLSSNSFIIVNNIFPSLFAGSLVYHRCFSSSWSGPPSCPWFFTWRLCPCICKFFSQNSLAVVLNFIVLKVRYELIKHLVAHRISLKNTV